MSANSFTTVNEHCLSNIRAVTARHEVVACEDICDEHGRKLWAKGQPVSEELHARLLARKLRAPLELSLDVKTGASPEMASQRALELLEQDEAFARLMGRQGRRACGELGRAPVERALKLLLTCTQSNGTNGFDHTVRVAALASAMALRAELPEREVTAVVVGGLAHDIGELYVNPEYLSSKRALTLSEWRHVVAHPLIGKKVVQELTTLPRDVADVVVNHHERENGTGYPLQSLGAQQSRPARLVALAESLSGVLQARDNPVARAALALKLVQGEFSADVLKQVMPQCTHRWEDAVAAPADFDLSRAKEHARQVAVTLEHAQTLALAVEESVPALKHSLAHARDNLARLEASLRSTGLLTLVGTEGADDLEVSASVFLELDVVPREIAWRLRNMARGLSLAATLNPGASAGYLELADVLAGAGRA